MNPSEIHERLAGRYKLAKIDVVDLTGTRDHYHIKIESAEFKNLPRIQTHRQVMDLFETELKTGEIHAFTISATVPKE